jgi:hypothetical protein
MLILLLSNRRSKLTVFIVMLSSVLITVETFERSGPHGILF